MGSEMCIRDRHLLDRGVAEENFLLGRREQAGHGRFHLVHEVVDCLLYTSDAADERSSVDLGGRRIIKKKK